MYKKIPVRALALAVVGCTAFGSVQAATQTSVTQATLDRLQQQIQQLQQQLQQLKAAQQQQQQQIQQQQVAASTQTEQKKDKSGASLNVFGGVEAGYSLVEHDEHGGSLSLSDLQLGVSGDAGNGITYAAEYRWGESGDGIGVSGATSHEYMHYAWAAYNFGADDSSQIKGGYFQVPFGNLPFGYQSFYAPMRYYMGFNDEQAAGIGYKYEHNGWRFDIAAFKNDDFGQSSTYGGNTSDADGYNRINGGVVRLGRTLDLGGDNSLNLSASVRGGQLVVPGDHTGSHWAGALAATANLGLWTVSAQANDYRYNVPGSVAGGDQSFVTFQEAGFRYNIPASGELYSFSLARSFPVDLGPISNFTVYDDFGYLHSSVDYPDYFSPANMIDGNSTNNVAGVSMTAGPVMIWAEWVAGKNAYLAFAGDNDGDWHNSFHLTAAYYFDGDLIK